MKYQPFFVANYYLWVYNDAMEISVSESLMRLATQAKCKVYIVGGKVRNSLLGLGDTDIDICGQLQADQLGLSDKYQIVPVNRHLGTALICCGDEQYEYTPFRSEHYPYGGGHTPDQVQFGVDLLHDALRRDFTCNSIYYDIADCRIVDPLGGVDDALRRVLRCYNAANVFANDGLRLMRMARIAAELGFTVDDETLSGARLARLNLSDICSERKQAELNRILQADNKYGVKDAHYRGLRMLADAQLWQFIIPEVAATQGVDQNPKYHRYDVMEHTFVAVREATPRVRLAALMHDLGKPVCMARDGNTYTHYVESAAIVRRALGAEGLKYPIEIIKKTERLVYNHMYDMDGKARESKVRFFVACNYDIIPELVELIRADSIATGMNYPQNEHRFMRVYREMSVDGTPINLRDLAVSGIDVMNVGIEGKLVGDILTQLHRQCIIDPSNNDRDKLLAKISRMAHRYG